MAGVEFTHPLRYSGEDAVKLAAALERNRREFESWLNAKTVRLEADGTVNLPSGSTVNNADPMDHGTHTGLADDDHTQYHNDARAATWHGGVSHDHGGLAGLGDDDHPQYLQVPGAMTSYAVAWTASGTAPAIGNGVLSGKYFKMGRAVDVEIFLDPGTTTTFGTGTWWFSLPVTGVLFGVNVCGGSVRALQGGVRWTDAIVAMASATKVSVEHQSADYGPTVPVTWNSNGFLHLAFSYESAS